MDYKSPIEIMQAAPVLEAKLDDNRSGIGISIAYSADACCSMA